MKNSFSLLLTIVLITIFAFISINFFEQKSFKVYELKSQVSYIQAKNHMIFLKEIIKDYEFNEKFEVLNDEYEIKAIKKDGKIHLFVKSRNDNISIHEIAD